MIKLKNIITEGQVITCMRGQWDHPGKITRIPNNHITMKPDPRNGKPIRHILLIIGDQSKKHQIGIPGGPDLHFPDDTSVTEYPIKRIK